jgi:hypothetical protein
MVWPRSNGVKNRIPTEPRGNFLHHKGLVFVGEGALALPHFGHVLRDDPAMVFQRELEIFWSGRISKKPGRTPGGLKHPPLQMQNASPAMRL